MITSLPTNNKHEEAKDTHHPQGKPRKEYCRGGIGLLNNNWINAKYHQMAFQSLSDGALISPSQSSFGIPGQTKVSGDRQRETTHEICCLAAEFRNN